jgi:ceramide glucosyltransferase
MASMWSMACGYALLGAATLYGIIVWLAALAAFRSPRAALDGAPQVTLLKPLCGAEPETYDCLRSFCDQSYSDYQIVFGVADPDDPAVAVVRQLQWEYPEREIRLIVDRRQHGSSRKVSNLINMLPHASHEYLILADSDVRVRPDYLARLVAALLDPTVGIVTCAYRGVARRGIWSTLGAMFINEWFTPSVQVAARGGSRGFAFGATIGLRRQVLARIGGLSGIVNHLADDYRLGELTRGLGLRTVLSEVQVEVVVVEDSFGKLVQHELRWLRTIRAVRPLSYAFCFVTFGLPVALLGTLLCQGRPMALSLLAVTLTARVLLHLKNRHPHAPLGQIVLVPFRDFLSIGIWLWSFVTRRVRWRDKHYLVFRDGSALPVARY